MSSMLFLGLDIGTTGAKALLVDGSGSIRGKGYRGYPLVAEGERVEQGADDWTACGALAIREALGGNDPKEVAALSLSTQGASTVAVDRDYRPIGNALTWMDTRAMEEAEALRRELGDEYVYRSTGWRINPSLDAAKILHMKRSADYSAARCFLTTLEYANLFLTGNPVCDPTNAAIRQLYGIEAGDYDERILAAACVSRRELPLVLPTGARVGSITAAAAAATGVPQGTPVFNGAHDQYCASIGAGAVEKGDMVLSAGTTWVVMGIGDKPLFTDTYIAPGAHPVAGLYGAICSLVGSGASLEWFKNEFAAEDFAAIDRRASEGEERTEGLFYYPYLAGSGYPIWNPAARGAFVGLSLGHTRFDLARAIMEGAAFGVRGTLDDFARNGSGISSLKVIGGAAKSGLWCSIIAAAANVSIQVSRETDACARGAAIIAAKGAGAFQGYRDAVGAMVGPQRAESPDVGLASRLSEKYARYQEMWRGIGSFYLRK